MVVWVSCSKLIWCKLTKSKHTNYCPMELIFNEMLEWIRQMRMYRYRNSQFHSTLTIKKYYVYFQIESINFVTCYLCNDILIKSTYHFLQCKNIYVCACKLSVMSFTESLMNNFSAKLMNQQKITYQFNDRK